MFVYSLQSNGFSRKQQVIFCCCVETLINQGRNRIGSKIWISFMFGIVESSSVLGTKTILFSCSICQTRSVRP